MFRTSQQALEACYSFWGRERAIVNVLAECFLRRIIHGKEIVSSLHMGWPYSLVNFEEQGIYPYGSHQTFSLANKLLARGFPLALAISFDMLRLAPVNLISL